jgi:ankyrin repeat protein
MGDEPEHKSLNIFSLAELGKLEELQQYTGNLDEVSFIGHTALCYAIFKNRLDCVKCLVKKGASVNKVRDQSWSPLACAADVGNLEYVEFLVENGAVYDYGAFLMSVIKGHIECIRYFVDKHNADINAYDEDGRGVVQIATLYGHLNCVKYFVEEKGMDVHKYDEYGQLPIHAAARRGLFDLLVYLVEKGSDVNAVLNNKRYPGYTPLSLAIQYNNSLKCPEYLLQHGALIDALPGMKSPLHHALAGLKIYMIVWLLSNGADPFKDIKLHKNDNSSYIFLARVTFKERQAIQAMMSAKVHSRLGQQSSVKVLPVDIIRHLHSYFV